MYFRRVLFRSVELEYDEANRPTSAEQHEVAEIQSPIPIDEPVEVPIPIEDYLRTDLDAAIFCPSKKAVLRTCFDFSAQEAPQPQSLTELVQQCVLHIVSEVSEEHTSELQSLIRISYA